MAFSRNPHNWQLGDAGAFVLLCNSWCPPSPPSKSNKMTLHGWSPFRGRGGWRSNLPPSCVFWQHFTGDQGRREGLVFIHFSCWSWGGAGGDRYLLSWPSAAIFYEKQHLCCTHPLVLEQEGGKWYPLFYPALTDGGILLFLWNDFSSLLLDVTLWEIPSLWPSQQEEKPKFT